MDMIYYFSLCYEWHAIALRGIVNESYMMPCAINALLYPLTLTLSNPAFAKFSSVIKWRNPYVSLIIFLWYCLVKHSMSRKIPMYIIYIYIYRLLLSDIACIPTSIAPVLAGQARCWWPSAGTSFLRPKEEVIYHSTTNAIKK